MCRRPAGWSAALRELAIRYFSGHGPATDRDLARWSGLPLGEVRAGLAEARDALESLDVGGVTYWHGPGLEPTGRDVHLLAGFDEFLLGYADRSAQLDPERFDAIVPGGNGVFHPTVVVDGRIAGLWRRVKTGSRRVVVGLTMFEPPTAAVLRGVRKRLDRYGEFLGVEVELAG